ncbi:nitrate- and nitrite sensing domain-containing protein [Streptomyces sp. NPDC021212]|uniref:sensor histidine kinase n=1 Tax=Streptomyces sp. NPDC021212 TaxID=3365118 RepID=UPI0037B287C9
MSTFLVPRSIRAKIVCLLMVPAVSLMAMWGLATVTTARGVSELSQYKEANSSLLNPLDSLVTAVQSERSAALRQLAAPSRERADDAAGKERNTDAAVAALRSGIRTSSLDSETAGANLTNRVDQLMTGLDGLGALRERSRGRDAGWREAYDAYNSMIGRAFALEGSLAIMPGPDTASAARVVLELAHAREMIAREDALMGAAQVSDRITAGQYVEFVGAAHTQRYLLSASVDDLRAADAARYRKVLTGSAMRDLRGTEDAMFEAGARTQDGQGGPDEQAGHVAASAGWSTPAGDVLQQLAQAQQQASTGAADDADPLSFDALGGSGVAMVLDLVGVVLSLVISVRIGRGLIVELTGLRNTALTMAGRELPRAIARLHAGQPVDLDAVAPTRPHRADEVGQVGASLVAVHRAAVKAAADRAEILHGISGVYVNLARRSQTLVHRQLALLDTMERRNEDPVELEDLFRLDHLSTRMRRHSESLIILSGAMPGRRWRHPVPLMDIVRAAVAEVEDYDRMLITDIPAVRVPGAAVADLTHLLAELVENATAFSPPPTRVRVSAERVGAGIALEIEDRGLGMEPSALAEANRRITDTERIDLLDSGQLGLFVVNRLAHRLDVRVALRSSVYGGIVAVVLLPGHVAGEPIDETGNGAEAGEAAADGTTAGLPRRTSTRPGATASTGTAAADTEPGQVDAAPAPPVPVPAGPPEEPVPPTDAHDAEPVIPTSHSAPAQRPSPTTGEEPPPPAARPELPRRIRQAGPALEPSDETEPHEQTRKPSGRTPEEARATMASFRTGWTRGQAVRTPPQPPRESDHDTEGEGEHR